MVISDELAAQVQKIQEILQDTGYGSDDSDVVTSSSSVDDEKDTVENGMAPLISKAVCSGDGGCGETFSFDAPGSDFEYAMLCGSCYQKLSGNSEKEVVSEKADKEKEKGCDTGSGDEVELVEPTTEPTAEEEEKTCGSNEAGKAMALVLEEVRHRDKEGRYDVVSGGNDNIYVAYINDQDNVTGKSKKFWHLSPNNAPILYGFLNYQALLDTRFHIAWLGHCRLSTSKLGADGHGYVLWEFWETRCNDPRIDGILIKENGDVIHMKKVVYWLKKNELSSDVEHNFDEAFYKE